MASLTNVSVNVFIIFVISHLLAGHLSDTGPGLSGHPRVSTNLEGVRRLGPHTLLHLPLNSAEARASIAAHPARYVDSQNHTQVVHVASDSDTMFVEGI